MKSIDESLESYNSEQKNSSSNSILGTLVKPLTWLMSHPKSAIIVLLVIALIAWRFGGDNSAAQAKPLLVTVDKGDIENAVTAAGNLQPSEFVDVGAQVSGILEKLYVDVGDKVSAGQLLAEIDATVQLNRVEASRASLSALEAQMSARQAALTLAQANADRQTRMLTEDATSQADFDQAINTLASAQSGLIQLQSQIAQSKASLASDETTLSFSTISAPIEGTVISLTMKEGQTLNSSQQAPTILRIADLSTMTVQGEVSEADVSKLKPGMDVYFTTLGGGTRRWYGKLRQILPKPVVLNNVVLYTALFDVENTDNTLLSDMTAQIFFVTASAQDVIRVPVGALNFRDSNNLLNLKLDESDASVTKDSTNSTTQDSAQTEPTNFREQAGMGGMGNFSGLSEEQIAERRALRAAGGGGQRGEGGNRGQRRQADTSSASEAPTKAQVIVALEDGSYENREITIGVTTRISAEVLDGLVAGDQVIAGIIQARAETTRSAVNQAGGGRGGGGGRF